MSVTEIDDLRSNFCNTELRVSRERDGKLPGRSPPQGGAVYAREAAPIGVSSEKNFVIITLPEHEDDPRNWLVRKFTPLECERLQGFSDYWTDVPYKGALVADRPRYKAIGNSRACPNMAFIGHFLELAIFVDGITSMRSSGSANAGGRRRTACRR